MKNLWFSPLDLITSFHTAGLKCMSETFFTQYDLKYPAPHLGNLGIQNAISIA